ncbi:MAG: hypothetical protein ACJ72P_07260, partial [Nocardioides sp.]
GRYFGLADLAPRKDPRALVAEMRKHVEVVDVRSDDVLLRINEAALHRWHSNDLGVAFFVDGLLVSTVMLDGSDPALAVDDESLEPSICRVSVGIATAVRVAGQGGGIASVEVLLFAVTDQERGGEWESSVDAAVLRDRGTQILASPWHLDGVIASRDVRFNGVADKLENGMLRGWIYDAERRTFEVPLTIYANGRLVAHTIPNKRRASLDRTGEIHPSARGKGFQQQIPFGYFADQGASELCIEAFVAGTNIRLRRTPLMQPLNLSSASWDADAQTWLSAP